MTHSLPWKIGSTTGAGVLLLVVILLSSGRSAAVELPPPGQFYFQTNGANGSVGLGDWYSASDSGAGNHYIQFYVPCGWPPSEPIYVDLFSPEMNRVAGALGGAEEPAGNYDSTQFELYGPGATVGPNPPWNLPAAGAGIPGTDVTYQPGGAGVAEQWVRFATLAAPVSCGAYVLRSNVLGNDPLNPAGEGDDQNGWKLRIGRDDDADPTNAPPSNSDNPDGVLGTNDELVVGLTQTSYQHSLSGTQCQTLYEFVDDSQPSATFHNFDMDASGRTRYYAPSDVLDPQGLVGGTAGTVSGSTVWNNGGTQNTRVGDTINNPEGGWWAIVTCLGANNQFIVEGQTGVPLFYSLPPTPDVVLTIDDGVTQTNPNDTRVYTIVADNQASGPTAGASLSNVITNPLPSNVTYQSCAILLPATGVCSESGGVVTATLDGWINAGDSVSIEVTVTVNNGATGFVVMPASVDYQDELGDNYPPSSASDTDTILTPTPSPSPTPIPTDTPTPVPTDTPTPVPTDTPTPVPTDTPTPVPTDTPTPVPTGTPTPVPTGTPTPVPTDTPSPTPSPTLSPTPTLTPTGSLTPRPTRTANLESTETPTPTPTVTPTAAPSSTGTTAPTPTLTPTAVPTTTVTGAPSSTGTALATPSATAVPTPTATPTEEPTPTTAASSSPATTTAAPTVTTPPTQTPAPTPTATPVPANPADPTQTVEVSPPAAPTGTGDAGAQTPAQLPLTGGTQNTSGGVPLGLEIAMGLMLVAAAAFCCDAARRTV